MNNRKHFSTFEKKFAIFFVFVVILSIILYPILENDSSLTSNVVGNEVSFSPEKSFEIQAGLTIPKFSGKGDYDRIYLVGNSASVLHVNDKEFDLDSQRKNYIEILNYSGKISFDDIRLNVLSGNVGEIVLNGVSLKSRSGGTVNVQFENGFVYSSLEINDNFYIKELRYNAKGTLVVGDNLLRLDKQNVTLQDFVGDLEIFNRKMNLNGEIERVVIKGSPDIVLSV